MKALKILFFVLLSSALFGQNPIDIANKYLHNIECHELLFVSIKKQKMYHLQNDSIIKEYIISSSAYGIGSKAGSNKTPIGLHRIAGKFGSRTPENGRMVGRIFYGDIAAIYTDNTKSKTDDVTSRIFWLDGMEKGKNKGKGIDSYLRYIYIHGTSEEGRLGKPASHGCIRMKNKAIIDLYKLIEVGTLVLIL